MSGQRETSFPIHDSRQAQRLRNREVSGRVERLFCVEVTLKAPSEAAAGSQQKQEDNCHWVTLKTSNGSDDSTEKAKTYILSLCGTGAVQECHTDLQFVQQLLSESSKLRDNLETEFQTVILPGSSPSCVRVQGTEPAIQKTVAKIHSVMAPSQYDGLPQPQPPSPQPRPPSSQSRPFPPPSTAGTFSPSPPPPSANLSSTSDAEQETRDRTTPHELANIPTPNGTPLIVTQPRLMTEKEEILQKIALDIEKDSGVVSRGVDSSHREQTIQYFISLGFPREKIEAVVDSMGSWAELDDILKRLNTLHVASSRPVAALSVSRPYTNRGEPLLNSNATLRPVVIDGSNVAMRHGNGRVFSCRGIQIAVNWFAERGHKEITVFVPQWRRETPRAEYPITDQEILNQLERDKMLSFTPSRRIGNKRIVCYDDRFIVRLASETNGVIVSNDNYRDLAKENENWRRTIENRLLMFTFVNDIFMVPDDPFGKHGPGLTQLLQMDPPKSSSKGGPTLNRAGPQVCPYGERCNFGRKCRFLHPEREGRLDPSVFVSRSANVSPAPAERRHAGGVMSADVQKDSISSHADRLSPSMDRSGPTGQPIHSSPQRPRTSPSFLAETDVGYNHPPHPLPSSHTYSQPQSMPYTHSYSQLPRDYLPHSGMISDEVCGQNQPQYLRLPLASSGNSLSPPTLHPSPRHSNPSTPLGGGCVVSYPSHTFPIATLSTVRSRNMTDRIQPSISPIPNGSNDDFQPTAPNLYPIISPHQHSIEPPLGLLPRGDCPPTPYPSLPPAQYHTGNPHEMYHNLSSNSYHHHHPSYHVPANVFPPSAASPYTHTDPPPPQHHRHHSPTKGGHHGDYSATPSSQMPPQTNTYHNHLQTSEPHAYSAENNMYQQDQRQNRLLQHQVPPHGIGGHMVNNDPSEYRPQYMPQGPRAVSMYGDLGMRRHLDKIAGEKFQSSQSSPELYCDTNRRQQLPPPANAALSSTINWTLFKQAQARLPNQEERIMKTMQQHPHADLEHLVELIQPPW